MKLNKNIEIICYFLAVLSVSLITVYELSVSIFIFFSLSYLLGFISIIPFYKKKELIRWYSFVFCISVLFTIALYVVYLNRYDLPYFIGGSDDLTYEEQGKMIANHLWLYSSSEIQAILNKPWHDSEGYVYVVSLIVRIGEAIGGFHTLMPRFLNCTGLGLLFPLTYSVVTKIDIKHKEAIKISLITCLLPIMLYTAAHTFRDIIICLLLVSILLFSLKIIQSKTKVSLWYTLLILILILILSEFRYLQIIAAGGMLIVGWYSKVGEKIPNQVIVMLGIGIVLVGFIYQDYITKNIEIFFIAQQALERYGEMLAERDQGLSQKLFTLSFPFNIIGRFSYAAVTPLPIPSTEIERNFLSLGTIVQYFYYPFIFMGLFYMRKFRKVWPLVVGFLILFFGYVFGTFTFRHIVQIAPFAVILAYLGQRRYSRYKGLTFLVLAIGFLVSSVVYLRLKGIL